MVGIFDSELGNLQKAMQQHQVPFTILADEQYEYFSKYNVRRSVWGIIRAMFFRFPRVMKAMMQYIPLPINGHFSIYPVDIFVDEEGVVQQVQHGKNIADHFSFNEVNSFST